MADNVLRVCEVPKGIWVSEANRKHAVIRRDDVHHSNSPASENHKLR